MAGTLSYTPPHSKDAEKAVLGAVLREPDLLNGIVDKILPDQFFVDAHARIFAAMRELYDSSKPTDLLTVADKLRRAAGGDDDDVSPAFLVELMENAPIAQNIDYYAELVRDYFYMRQIINACQATVRKALSFDGNVKELVADVEKEFISITNMHDRSGLMLARDVLDSTLAELEDRLNCKGGLTGVTSGFADLDRLTGGFQRSDMVLVGARPGMGKTAFALNCAVNAARAGHPVAIFSLEMQRNQLMMRIISAEARVDFSRMRKGDLDEDARDRLMIGARNIAAMTGMAIDETPSISLLELRSRCRRYKKEYGLDMVVIDYLQLMRGFPGKRYDSREQEVSEISRELKGLAKELNVSIMALAQLNRDVEKRQKRTPMISDLRESGSIEQDADQILLLYRDEYYNQQSEDAGKAIVHVAKNRHGATDQVQLAFMPNFMKFSNLHVG